MTLRSPNDWKECKYDNPAPKLSAVQIVGMPGGIPNDELRDILTEVIGERGQWMLDEIKKYVEMSAE